MFNRDAQLLGRETSKAANTSATLKRLWTYFRPFWVRLLLVFTLISVATGAQALVPALIGQTVDCYLGPYAARTSADIESDAPVVSPPSSDDTSVLGGDAYSDCQFGGSGVVLTADETLAGLAQMVLLIAGLFILANLVSGFAFYQMTWVGNHMLRNLRQDVFHHVHKLSLGYFTKHEAGDVMSRFTNDADTMQQVLGFGLLNVFQSALLIGVTIYAMFALSVPLALVALVTLPLMVIVTRWLANQARKAFTQARQEIGSVNADLQESISAVREVQAFSREEENIEQFRTSNAANRDANNVAQMFTSALAPSLEALSYVSLALVACLGGIMLLNGSTFLGATISVGLIIAFIGYTQQFNRPVQQIALLWANVQSALAGAERIFQLLDAKVDIEDSAEADPIPSIQGHVIYDNVWAEYNPGQPVLRGINISAEPGDTVAIVGPTGAGKTTIINLLPRFWDVVDGSVKIDGKDVRDVTRPSLRRQIGFVLQDTFLFSDTVANNIRYGRPDASDEDVMSAAKLARAHDFITRLPNGYDTVLGERGGGLSQGQRQLLSIARVALDDPRILILDEATSSVDTRTEREIQQALEQLLAGRTSFVIAHRLSTIRNADQVLVLQDGEIIERGTHDSLLEAEGFYHSLYMSQFRRTVDTDAPDSADDADVSEFFVMGD